MKTFQRFLIVLGVFVFAYNASSLVHELGHALTVVATGGGILLAVVVSVTVHFTWRWCDGPETQCRAIPINWGVCLLSLVLGGGIVATECLVFRG